MFKKPYRIKSNNQIRGSEKKTLKELILRKFPILTEPEVEDIIPKKETAFCTKVLTATYQNVIIYSVQKRALFFSIDDHLYPSIYLLWRYPRIGITFTTNDFVISKITRGADLMMPGVLGNPCTQSNFLAKQVAVVNNVNNPSAIAVGAIALSSTEMQSFTNGKCAFIYHFYGDYLCSMDEMPILPLPQQCSPEEALINDLTPLNCDTNEKPEETTITDEKTEEETLLQEKIEQIHVSDVAHMDEKLRKCFLTALKYSKSLETPILTSTFYKLEMIAACPPNESIDVKKSSYKKVGQFLKAMEAEGFIVIKEKKKGVEMIAAIDREHEEFRKFYVAIENRPRKQVDEVADEQKREIVESLAVTQAVLPLFKAFDVRKGETMTTTEVRAYVTRYVKQQNLQRVNDKRFVHVKYDAALKALCKDEDAVTWEDLMATIVAAMKPCFRIDNGLEATVSRGNIPPIMMTTQLRSGNKKVTLVDNLALYHINSTEFAKECQRGVAASTCIRRPAGKRSDQILVQGNQILFVYKLLTGKYNIPKKYIRGLEFAPKTKK